MGDTYERTSQIRDIINAPRVRHTLMRDTGRWLQLCSALDAIEDCEIATEAFPSAMEGQDFGRRYLLLYGLLQALFLQQDALQHLSDALGVPFRPHDDPVLLRVRELRNASVGHPTRRNRRGSAPPTHHFISRISIAPEGFTLLSTCADGSGDHEDVRIADVLRDQASRVNAGLDACLSELRQQEDDHRARFAGEKLAALFPAALGYALEKMAEGLELPERRCTGRWGMEEVLAVLRSFEEALVRRGCDLTTYPGVEDWFREMQHPLDCLAALYGLPPRTHGETTSIETAVVFARYVRMRLPDLVAMAGEIDDEYPEVAMPEEPGEPDGGN